MVLNLTGIPNPRGTILIGAREITKADREQLVLQFHGRHLDASHVNKAFCCLTSSAIPQFFLEVWVKRFQEVEETLVTRFDPLEGSYPQWEPMKVGAGALHGGKPDTPIRFVCYIAGKRKPVGEFFSSVAAIEEGMSEAKEYVMPIPKGRNTVQTAGEIVVVSFRREQVFTFLDYITSGTQIQCSIAIDFTASNGFPDSKKSLHYCGGDKQNLYEQALTAVCEVVQDYNSGNEYPVLGFGARLPPDGRVSHEFFVNFELNPYCKGISGVLDAYHECVRKVEFWGPTNFSPVINHVASFAKMYCDGSQYFILLIVTDGIITDMHKTKEALVAASVLPLSVIIVGVGNADFGDMVELDGDVVPLVGFEGQKAARDIVQFVPFSEFIAAAAAISKGDENATAAKTLLAREVLAEVPSQVVSFMQGKKILPGQWVKKGKEEKKEKL
ncbi:copine-8-like [Ischnura elegans]|uniref:copine-8-like n=1 Tax=Ischnura elegans TaxID=197161 RepID=UPI001ED8AC1F|nr:copine-8-like [Ischnura elegans]